MSFVKKLTSDLDGVYWSSNNRGVRATRQDDNRAMFYENREQPSMRVPVQNNYFPPPTHAPSSQNNNNNDIQREILHQLRLMNDQIETIARNQQFFVTTDAWQRYLQHFEENFSELRQMLQYEQMPSPDVPEQCSVAVATCFGEPNIKQEPSNDEFAETLLQLGEKKVCNSKSLHEFQMQDPQKYYWVIQDAKTLNFLPITDTQSQYIEENYQNLLRYGKGVPRCYSIGNVNINFDSREGSVGETWVRFTRIKK